MSSSIRELKQGLKKAFLPALMLFLLGYIHYHTFSGERGLIVWYELSSQIAELQTENARLAATIAGLEADVRRLSVKKPDYDFIDELARSELGVIKKDEVVIYLPTH